MWLKIGCIQRPNYTYRHDRSLLTSTIDASIESHVMGFAAEESRLKGKVVDVKM